MAITATGGKIINAIAAGKKAGALLDFSPVRSMSVLNSMEHMDIADWQTVDDDTTLFIFGYHKWGSVTNQKVGP